MAMRGTSKRHDDEQGPEGVRRSETSSDDSNLMRGTVRSRTENEIGEETKKQIMRCLNRCNVDDREIEGKLVDHDPTSVVTVNQHSGDTRHALKIHQHDNVKCNIVVEERGISKACSHVVLWNLRQRGKTSKLH